MPPTNRRLSIANSVHVCVNYHVFWTSVEKQANAWFDFMHFDDVALGLSVTKHQRPSVPKGNGDERRFIRVVKPDYWQEGI
jgi:hypothetical protein